MSQKLAIFPTVRFTVSNVHFFLEHNMLADVILFRLDGIVALFNSLNVCIGVEGHWYVKKRKQIDFSQKLSSSCFSIESWNGSGWCTFLCPAVSWVIRLDAFSTCFWVHGQKPQAKINKWWSRLDLGSYPATPPAERFHEKLLRASQTENLMLGLFTSCFMTLLYSAGCCHIIQQQEMMQLHKSFSICWVLVNGAPAFLL